MPRKLERVEVPEVVMPKPALMRPDGSWTPRQKTSKAANVALIHARTYNTVTAGQSILFQRSFL